MADTGFKILKDVTCSAPVNIAIVKYWGKRDEVLHLPLNGSLSLTLDQRHLATKTRVRLSRDYDKDRIFLNEEESDINKRVATCLEEIRRRSRKRVEGDNQDSSTNYLHDSSVRVRIDSWNNFPTAAGLASSAAGYACLVYALSKAFHVEGEISDIARRGSGSACRSIYGGFVEWDPGFDATPSIARQLFPSSHWSDLRVCIVVVSDQRKSTPSSEGMKRSVATSASLHHRAKVVVPQRIIALREAIANRDFAAFAEITMKESNSLHAACLDSFPPLTYLNETSHQIIDLVHAVNSRFHRTILCYTFDAGPNAFLFFDAKDASLIRKLLCKTFHLDQRDSHQVRGMATDAPAPGEENDIQAFEDSCGDYSLLRGKAKFFIFTQPGPGPRILEES